MLEENYPVDVSELKSFADEALIRAAYASKAVSEFTSEVLVEIENTSVRNNAKRGVCGVLITDGERIIQILEGRADRVRELLDRIAADERHHVMKVFAADQIENRAFEKWNMAVRSTKSDIGGTAMAFRGTFEVFNDAPIALPLTNERIRFFRDLAMRHTL